MFKEYLRLIRFDKPIGTLLLLWPTVWALLIAYRGTPNFIVLLVFCLGVFLTRSAGCAINDFADSKFDGLVARTANRPLVTGTISRKSALIVTLVLSLSAFILAWSFLKPLTLVWSIPALLIFVSYPFFKRFFAVPQLYLGIAFSFGILMAFIEQSASIPLVGWLLFFANLFWVLAYDTIYALVDLPDDLKIGIKTSAITFGKYVHQIILVCYTLFILLMIIVGLIVKVSIIYYVSMLVVAIITLHIYFKILDNNREVCFKMFLINNKIGYVVCLGLLFNYYWRH